MTDEKIIEKMAKAMCLSIDADNNPPCEGLCYICKKQARAALAVARSIIRAQVLEEAATMTETHVVVYHGGRAAGVAQKTSRHYDHDHGNIYASAIRALKDKP